ncbi:MAG: histidine phosphatase family protein [Candidatus ainarchaeum sp.]|nr:histidine phosphatase family protein [Candidatus ainarchaeum sp.]
MPKSITFKNKKLVVKNVSSLQRHSFRKKIRDIIKHDSVGLTNNGKLKAKNVGANFPNDLKLKLYYSPSLRTRQTAYNINVGFKKSGGKVSKYKRAKRTGERIELIGKDVFKDNSFAISEFKRIGSKKMILNWLAGEYPLSKARSPEEMGERIIRRRLAIGSRATNIGLKGNQIINITHDWQILAVLKTFLGKSFFKKNFVSPEPNEGLKIFHTSKKDILEYQGQRFDVTKKLRKIRQK